MPKTILWAAVALLAAGISAQAAGPQALALAPTLTSTIALQAASAAREACGKLGFHVAVSVVDAAGTLLVTLRDDGAAPHTVLASPRKAYTALTTRMPTSQLVKIVVTNPDAFGMRQIDGLLILSGGLPIRSGESVVGAIGVSGSPGADGDDKCAAAGISAIGDRLGDK